MPITINLKPYPGAEYFTIKEHRRDFKSVQQPDALALQQSAIQKLRKLHGIPELFSTFLISQSELQLFQSLYKTTIVKDSPATGMVEWDSSQPIRPGTLLDLSFSFPLIPDDSFSFDAILIDPTASLGVPVDSCFVFSREEFIATESAQLSAYDAYLLDNTLDDIAGKGMELLVRETNYKAAVLYQMIEDCPALAPVADKKKRSKSMISALCDGAFAEKIEKMGYRIGISGNDRDNQITIANYATHSKEMIELFSDRIMAI